HRPAGKRRSVDRPKVVARPRPVPELLQRVEIPVFEDRLAEPFEKIAIGPEGAEVDVRDLRYRDLAVRHVVKTLGAPRSSRRRERPVGQLAVLGSDVGRPDQVTGRHDVDHPRSPPDATHRFPCGSASLAFVFHGYLALAYGPLIRAPEADQSTAPR